MDKILDFSLLWQSLLEVGSLQANQSISGFSFPNHTFNNQNLDRLCLAYITLALKNLDITEKEIQNLSIEELIHEFHILPRYQQFLSRCLQTLVKFDKLQKNKGNLTSYLTFSKDSLKDLIEKAKVSCEEDFQLVELVQHCGENLSLVMTGKKQPLNLLFPNGSFHMLENLYHNSLFARYYNMIIREILQKLVNSLPPATHLRILEIGGGTGGTTGWLLPVLPPEQTTYVFTDVSHAFLQKAKQKFSSYSFIQYKLLNIQDNPKEQGYEKHSFDIVIAGNVLHATRNLEESLQNIYSLLSSNALLLIWEMTQPELWFNITFGLILQQSQDELRQQQPFLSTDQWQKFLYSQNFLKVASFPEAQETGQSIIMAQAPAAPDLHPLHGFSTKAK